MASRFSELVIDSHDPKRLGQFWREVLGYDLVSEGDDEVEISGGEGGGPTLLFGAVPEGKAVKNRLHIDVSPVNCTRDEEVSRLVALGATPVDIGQGEVSWVVLADPEGNEFCVLRGG